MAKPQCSFMPLDVFTINEVNQIARKDLEQVILIFGGDQGKLEVLCGQCWNDKWTIVPPVCKILNWINILNKCFHEALVLHNHPKLPWHGEIIPTDSDITSTEFLKWQLALMGIKLHDHIIVSGNKKRSLLEMNLYNNGPIKTSGFEIKRFLYSFLVQVSLTFSYDQYLFNIS